MTNSQSNGLLLFLLLAILFHFFINLLGNLIVFVFNKILKDSIIFRVGHFLINKHPGNKT